MPEDANLLVTFKPDDSLTDALIKIRAAIEALQENQRVGQQPQSSDLELLEQMREQAFENKDLQSCAFLIYYAHKKKEALIAEKQKNTQELLEEIQSATLMRDKQDQINTMHQNIAGYQDFINAMANRKYKSGQILQRNLLNEDGFTLNTTELNELINIISIYNNYNGYTDYYSLILFNDKVCTAFEKAVKVTPSVQTTR